MDFDQVTLSSLNRHAAAVRADVGTPKVEALRAQMLRVAPSASVEACVELFDAASAERHLSGRPALVIDAIDDLATKAALITRCVQDGLPVISALGAGGKGDACALHVGRLSEVCNDPMAASLLKRLRKQQSSSPDATAPVDGANAYWEETAHNVTVVYTSESQQVALLPLPAGMTASELGSQPNFRVRVMPVMPPLPAAMGAALACHALSRLARTPIEPLAPPLPPLSLNYLTRIYRGFVKHETQSLGRPPSQVRACTPARANQRARCTCRTRARTHAHARLRGMGVGACRAMHTIVRPG